MTQWTFIVGWNKDDASYASLQAYIQQFYLARLPKGTPFMTAKWSDDVTSLVQKMYPIGDIGLIGHSFGGQKAVEVCGEIGRDIKKLVLIDPVDYHNPDIANVKGFAIPRNVLSARCFHRKSPTAQPWSAGISSPLIIDTVYVPTTSDPHGEYVWKADTINEVKAAT